MRALATAFRIARITLREIRLPLHAPFRTAHGDVDTRRVLLAELSDGEGHHAWSECVAQAAPSYGPDTVDGAWLALTHWIIPAVLGVRLESAADVHPRIEARVRGHQMPRATVEMGAWALDAERRGLSLAALLATTAGVAPRATVDTGVALGFEDDTESVVQGSREALAAGYRRIKLKVAPGRDVDAVRAVRGALGPHAPLSVDANGSYSLDEPAHRRALDALDELGLGMIEQPLAHDDLVQHARLQRHLRTPICLDESVRDVASAESMLALGSARMLNLKPGRVGGLHASLAIRARCVSERLPLWCGGMLESGIGRAYNVALASLPGFTEPGDLSPSARYWARDVVVPPWTMDDAGRVRVPVLERGLGVSVDAGWIDDLTARALTSDAP